MSSEEKLIETRFLNSWNRIAPQQPGGGVLVAVSGGLDSMVMAHLSHEAGIPMAIAHVNFSLRGKASDADEAYVKAWTEARQIPFFNTRFDTALEATTRRKGIQETAREIRYDWFETVRAAQGYGAILTAHHADDNAETFLINLFRGAGLVGLGGIPEVSGYVRRPLILFRKEELRAYAVSRGILFREDASNDSDDYLRNAIRHQLMPVLENLFPDPVEKLTGSASRLREATALYKDAVSKQLSKLVETRGADRYISIRKLRHAKPLTTICHEVFSPAGFLPSQLPQIIALMDGGTGRFVASPTHRVIRHRDHLVLTALSAGDTDLLLVDSLPATLETFTHCFDISEGPPPKTFSENRDEAWLDTAALKDPLVLRRVRSGDYFYPLGMERKKKKVARFFTALKVPRHEKEQAWVLESGGRIAWVAGYRIDERFKITARTAKAVRILRSAR